MKNNITSKGIIYIMTSVVSGLIKIGKTGVDNYVERMRHLESNGYYNVSGLKRYFAIEVDDYSQKEALLHEIFVKHQVGSSELFALDKELVQQLLLCFDGVIVFPEIVDKEEEFEKVEKVRTQSKRFSFYQKGLKNGDIISFVSDSSIKARVCGEREVDYNGEIYKLSPLAYKIFEQKNNLNTSGAYQGANYFSFSGIKLKYLPDV